MHANASTTEAAAEPEPSDSTTHPAINAVLVGDVLVVHEPAAEGEPLVLSAYNVFDDRRLWTNTRGPEGSGAWMQHFDASHVLVRYGSTLEVVDVRDGSIFATHELQGLGRFLWRDSGVCLLNADCRVDVIDCETARPLQSLRVGVSLRRPLRTRGENYRDPGCIGGPTIIGRAGNTLIFAMSNWETERLPRGQLPRSGADSWVGIDAQSGDIRWTQQHPRGLSTNMGTVGDFAWVMDDDQLTIVHGATGQVARQLTRPGVRFVFAMEEGPERLQLLSNSALEILDVAQGRRVARYSVPGGSIAAMVGAHYPSGGHRSFGASDGSMRFIWLGPDGATLHSETVAEGESIHDGIDGGRWASGLVPTSDAAGHSVAAVEFSVDRFHEPSSETGPPNRARVSRGGQDIVETDHDAWSLGEATQGDVHVMALFVSHADWRSQAEVRVVRTRD